LFNFSIMAALLLATCAPLGLSRAHAAGDTYFYQQAQAAAKAGKYALAAQDYEQAILRGHNDPDTYYQLGLAYSHLKRWNDAAWAIATALTDPAYSAAHQSEAQKALIRISTAGGANAGPPAVLTHATISLGKTAPPNPHLVAVAESQSAYQALLTSTFFVGPSFNKAVTYANVGALSKAAADLDYNSNTTAKFAYLIATPSPFKSLAVYAQQLFAHLNLHRAVLVVFTPAAATAYTDRLNAATAQRLASQWVAAHGSLNPADLAAGVARAVVKQADDNDNAATFRSAAIGVGVFLVVVILIGAAVMRVAGWSLGRAKVSRPKRAASLPRTRLP
jgi:tetratricopeptide (TPR) repeat protein